MEIVHYLKGDTSQLRVQLDSSDQHWILYGAKSNLCSSQKAEISYNIMYNIYNFVNITLFWNARLILPLWVWGLQ